LCTIHKFLPYDGFNFKKSLFKHNIIASVTEFRPSVTKIKMHRIFRHYCNNHSTYFDCVITITWTKYAQTAAKTPVTFIVLKDFLLELTPHMPIGDI
jgi:hypothetical protein